MKDLFVGSADSHVKRHAWVSRPDIAGDSYHSFRQISQYCIDHGLPWVNFGDLFDVPYPASEDTEVVRQEIDRLTQAGLKFFYVQGNHDKAEPAWPAALSSHCVALDGQLVSIGEDVEKVHLTGIDALKRHELEPRLAELGNMKLPPKTILVCHQLLRETFSLDDAWDMTMDWVPKNIQLVLIGDDHRPTDLSKRTRWIYPGSGHVTRITEPLNKSFLVISTDGNNLFARRIPLKTRRYVRMILKNEADLDRVVRYVENTAAEPLTVDGMKPVLIATFPENLTDAEKRLHAVNAGKFIFWPDIKAAANPDQPEGQFEQAPAEKGSSLRDCLSRCVPPESEEFALVDQLLASPAALTETFNQWRRKKGVVCSN